LRTDFNNEMAAWSILVSRKQKGIVRGASELFEFLKSLHDKCLELSKEIRFDKKNPRQLHLIGLNGSIIELSGSITLLIDEKIAIGIPSLFRSMLEAFVELKNLCENAEYGYYMEASFVKEWLKIYREAKENPNPFLSEISKHDKLDSLITEYKKKLVSLKKRGYYPLKVEERFKRADMEDEYRSLYNFLSRDAHSNISALIGRHYEIDGDDFSVTYYRDVPIQSLVVYIDSVAGILVKSAGMIHGLFKTGTIKEIKALDKKLSVLRKKYL